MITLIQHYFSESAARHPDKVALACGEARMSYGEAEARSNALARRLQDNGVQRGQFVPFFMDKGIDSIICILAILKADCAYVPIDVKSPAGRLVSILEVPRTGAE